MAAPSTTSDVATAAATTTLGQADPLAGMLVRTSLGLLLVLGLLFALAWGVRRWGQRWRQTGQIPMQIVGSLALGPRERIVILEVGATYLVVGVSHNGMQTLHTLSAEELPAALAAGGVQVASKKTATARTRNAAGVVAPGSSGSSASATETPAATSSVSEATADTSPRGAPASLVEPKQGFTTRLRQAVQKRETQS